MLALALVAALLAPELVEPVIALEGVAAHRQRLRGGGVVQVNAWCSEWGGMTAGVAAPTPGDADAPIHTFTGGPFVEILDDRLLIEEHHGAGSDGSGEPPRPPVGATGVVDALNGAYHVTRMVRLDLRDGSRIDAGWDSYAGLAALGSQRFVIVARDPVERSGHEPRRAQTLERWDLHRGELRVLARPDMPLEARRDSRTVTVRVGLDEVLQLDGTSGAVTRSKLESPLEAHTIELAADPLASDWGPLRTTEPSLRVRSGGELIAPAVGGCGWGALRVGELVFVDGGVYRAPS
ncbi:hypothetical protein PPSIR1_07138 [Plesiocystis pacifica SIR-1]|uniref:Uncharacterized protein n=1 Tax=Plesiocystis pacifica SIR-1 TaxID=391625 RepID=A6G586_9BACT|nr:hypothetical protein [Plesiocystis pacifica]EDM78998.1 hypothetical protein PPSIR1_07138 [Plesiocystis pacifica SIR-1]